MPQLGPAWNDNDRPLAQQWVVGYYPATPAEQPDFSCW